MTEMKVNELEELNVADDAKDGAKDDHFVDEPRDTEGEEEKALHKLDYQHEENQNAEHIRHSRQEEDETMKKKYGGLLAKKHPLISKDHERAFFDSADWALNKQGLQKSKCPLEALRPKLEKFSVERTKFFLFSKVKTKQNLDIPYVHKSGLELHISKEERKKVWITYIASFGIFISPLHTIILVHGQLMLTQMIWK